MALLFEALARVRGLSCTVFVNPLIAVTTHSSLVVLFPAIRSESSRSNGRSTTKETDMGRFSNAVKQGLLLCACCALGSCGGGSTGTPSTSVGQPLEISGNWTVNAVNVAGASGALVLDLVSSPCVVNTPAGTLTVTGATVCFIAASGEGGEGSLSFTGSFLYTPELILIGVQADPVPANGSETVFGFLVEASGPFDAVFDISGTIQASSKSVSGSFVCDQNSENCVGISGTISGMHQ